MVYKFAKKFIYENFENNQSWSNCEWPLWILDFSAVYHGLILVLNFAMIHQLSFNSKYHKHVTCHSTKTSWWRLKIMFKQVSSILWWRQQKDQRVLHCDFCEIFQNNCAIRPNIYLFKVAIVTRENNIRENCKIWSKLVIKISVRQC